MENVTEVLYLLPKKKDENKVSYPDLATGIEKLLENPVWGAFYREEKRFCGGGWMGWPTCVCGEKSKCSDILVKTEGGLYGFNSLVPHYLLKHGDEISVEDIQLIKKILSEKKLEIEIPLRRPDIYNTTLPEEQSYTTFVTMQTNPESDAS
jgi:hypothetical protein